MGKILVFASVAISLATAALGFVNKGKLGEKTQEAATAQANADAAKKQATDATTQLTKAKNDLQTATADKEQAIAEATQVKSDLEKSKAAAVEATGKVASLETELANAKAELDSAKKLIAEQPAGGTAPAQTGPDPDTVAKLQEQETLINSLQQQLADTKRISTEYQDKEKARQTQQLKKGTEGRVLAVNPAWNFVVLNLGDKQGVANNTELLVKRGTRYLGKVRITSVEPSTSIADIVANSMPQGTTITPGDNVIFQGSEE